MEWIVNSKTAYKVRWNIIEGHQINPILWVSYIFHMLSVRKLKNLKEQNNFNESELMSMETISKSPLIIFCYLISFTFLHRIKPDILYMKVKFINITLFGKFNRQ